MKRNTAHQFGRTYQSFLAAAKKRRERAGRLRAEGKTYQEIGKELGVTRQRVYAILKSLESV